MSDAGLLARFAQAVARWPDRVAIVEGSGREVTFRALDARRQACAARWQAQGIGPGDRVLLAMGLGADLYASLAALWSLGATVVLPEPAMGLAGVRHAARVARPKALCTSGIYHLLRVLVPDLWRAQVLRPAGRGGEVAPQVVGHEDIALISFTSGTSGAPKAIPRSHGFLAAQYAAVAPLLKSDLPERDLVCFPVFALINLAEGRCTVLPDFNLRRLDRVTAPALTQWIARQRVTRALLPPVLCDVLADEVLPDGLRRIFTGGGPVFPDVVARMRVPVTCVYGSTEAEPIAHLEAEQIRSQDMIAGRGLLVGHPVPQVQLRLQEGEVQVAGGHVNPGYLDPAHDAETKLHEDGVIWHRTGDAGCLDDDGRLWLLGRLGSEVRAGGRLLYPFAIEAAARRWPGVRRSALMPLGGGAVLVIEGDARHLPAWQTEAQALGIQTVHPIRHLPMDRRHHSKVDRVALAHRIG